VAALLARESKGLLIGEAATHDERVLIHDAAQGEPAIVAVRRPVTMYFGPHSMLVAMDVEFKADLTATDIAGAVDRLESRIRQELPDVKHIYIEAESIRSAAGEQQSRPGAAS